MKKKIVVLSAYNRALWLATELKLKGHDVVYLDFSEKLGGLSPEAWDPPFGIFQTKKTNYSQNIWLSEGATIKKNANGFTVLAEKGPMEFQGSLSRLSFKRYLVDQDELDYLKSSVLMGDEAFGKFKNVFKVKSFEEVWLLHFAHQLASQTFIENAFAIENKNRPLPLSDDWSIRTMSRRGAQESLSMARDKGVVVYTVKGLKGFKINKSQIEDLHIIDSTGNDPHLTGDLFLNFLSQEELNAVHSLSLSQVMDGAVVQAEWFWTRYRFFTNQNDVTEVLPQAFCMIQDRFISWTYQNLIIVHRGLRSHEFIAWVRVPSNYRLQQNRLENLGQEIQKVFLEKFPGLQIEQMELPLECLATEFLVQAPHLPVFSEKSLAFVQKPKQKNFIWCGPEVWKRLDMAYLLEYQIEIMNLIEVQNDQQGIKRRRGRDQEIYS